MGPGGGGTTLSLVFSVLGCSLPMRVAWRTPVVTVSVCRCRMEYPAVNWPHSSAKHALVCIAKSADKQTYIQTRLNRQKSQIQLVN